MFETKVAIDQNIQIFNFKGPFSDMIYSVNPLMMNKHFKTKKIFYDRIFSRGGLSCFQLSIPCIEYPEYLALKKWIMNKVIGSNMINHKKIRSPEI